MRYGHGSGFQPFFILCTYPGPSAQAGMVRAVGPESSQGHPGLFVVGLGLHGDSLAGNRA
jgi:hypothetical protein